MNNPVDQTVQRSEQSALATNKVLRNTYMLLAMTVIFSGVTAFIGMAVNIQGLLGSLVPMIAALVIFMFVLPKTAESSMGLVWVFVGTGLMGFAIGPLLNYYLAVNPAVVGQALFATGIIFFSLSAYAISSKKDFSYMGAFLMTGIIAIIVASIMNIFLGSTIFSAAISAVAIMLYSGFILFDTSRIMKGGETNYIMATVQLYINVFGLFIHLLNLLGIMSDD